MERTKFGSCRVVERMAAGHLTEVFRAVQEPMGRQVAVKALKPTIAASSPFAVALAREAQILSLFRHDNIPRLLDFYQGDSGMWLVLELTDGFTLRTLLDVAGRLDEQAVVAIGLEVARALAHAHDHGVVHCDVRPSNVLVAKDGRVTLTDFGSAQADNLPSSPEPVEAEPALAAPAYMSPEQILGESIDARSDVFLLGILLYEMLAGVRPFQGADDRTVAHSIRHDEPPSLESQAPNVPRPLAQIVVTCLQKNPADRYASARELCAALEGSFPGLAAHPRRHVIASALARARLIDRPPPSDEEKPELLGTEARRPTIGPAVRMLLLMLALVVAGGVSIHLVFRADLEAKSAAGAGPLELVPQDPGSLRVIARPWAHVIIDGQHVETTPFARPIALAAGVHHITLRHPDATDERRVVRLAPGERVLLDVTMQVRTKPRPSASAPTPAPSASTP